MNDAIEKISKDPNLDGLSKILSAHFCCYIFTTIIDNVFTEKAGIYANIPAASFGAFGCVFDNATISSGNNGIVDDRLWVELYLTVRYIGGGSTTRLFGTAYREEKLVLMGVTPVKEISWSFKPVPENQQNPNI